MRAMNRDEKDFVYSASFVEDLGADTADLIELVICIEEEFNIRISDEEAERMLTVGDTLNFLYDKGIR